MMCQTSAELFRNWNSGVTEITVFAGRYPSLQNQKCVFPLGRTPVSLFRRCQSKSFSFRSHDLPTQDAAQTCCEQFHADALSSSQVHH